MKRLAGQAGRLIGRALHQIGLLILTIFSLLIIAFCLLAFRLSQGPLQIPYLATELADAVSGQGVDIHIKKAALAWAGYHTGGGTPLYLQLDAITASNAEGVALAVIPNARLVFLPGALLGTKAPILVNSANVHFNGSNVAVSLRAAIRLGIGFRLSQADLFVTLGPGEAGAGGDSEPISGGAFTLHLTPHDVALTNGALNLARFGASAPVLSFHGAGHFDTVWAGTLTLRAGQVQAPDLANYWPPALAAQTRHWVTTNIAAGTAHDANFVFSLGAPKNLSNVSLTNASGGFAADHLTLKWIPGAQPITGLSGTLTLQDKNDLLITASAARLGGIALQKGSMKITGVSQKDQTGIVTVTAGGRIEDALAVLNAPPLSLLAHAPAELASATGNVTANISTTLPLKNKLKLADIALTVDAKLSNTMVPTPISDVAFTGGALNLHATTKSLRLNGTSLLDGEPASTMAQVDFTQAQPLRFFQLKTMLGPSALRRMGLTAETALTDAVSGAIPVDLQVKADQTGAEQAALDADLTAARMGVPVLGWAKAAGAAGSLKITATVDNDNSVSIDRLDAVAPALAIHGAVKNRMLHLSEMRIGRSHATGDITPATATSPWRIVLHGPVLDIRAILTPAKGTAAKQAVAKQANDNSAPSGPAWQASLAFATLYLAAAPAPALQNIFVSGNGKGASLLAAEAQADSPAGKPVNLLIKPVSADGARRSFHLDAGDTGQLLRVVAAYDNLQGGVLVLDGTYGAGAAFDGTTTLTKFSILQAPAFGKILQAVTIYGAAEAAAGPGLLFDKLAAPFTISHQVLTLHNARAFSASLGFTASGTIGLADGQANLDTTIIPAYALNTLPGKIPLIGRLFRAEKGGGLISMRAKITGQLTDPKIAVNPLSIVTPGALQGVFGVGEKKESK